jgi:hypothetical protein
MEARDGYFLRLYRLCIPRSSELRLGLIFELHVIQSACHIGVACTLGKSLDICFGGNEFAAKMWKTFCESCVVCRFAKIQPQMAANFYSLHVPPIPWPTVGVDYLTHLPVSKNFESGLIVVDHMTRMAHFLQCKESVTTKGTVSLFFAWSLPISHGLPRVLVGDRDPKFVSDLWHTLWRHLGKRLNMSSTRHPETDGLIR